MKNIKLFGIMALMVIIIFSTTGCSDGDNSYTADVPGVVTGLTATPGNMQVVLSWAAPADDGGAAITKYEVSDDDVTAWATADSNIGHTVTGLTNGKSYTFKVRAVSTKGAGAVSEKAVTPTVGAITWTLATTTGAFAAGSVIRDIAWNGTKFVAGSQSTELASSTDGITWTSISHGCFADRIQGIAWGANKFVAVGRNGSTTGEMAHSADGTTNWTMIATCPITGPVQCITYGGSIGNQIFIAAGSNSMARSADGETWTDIPTGGFGFAGYVNGIVWGGNKFIAIGQNGMAESANGTNWTPVTDPKIINFNNGAWGGPARSQKFIAVADAGKMVYSANGTNWTEVADTKLAGRIRGIAWGNGRFVAGAESGMLAESFDGVTWNEINQITGDIYNIRYANNKFITVGASGKIAYSN